MATGDARRDDEGRNCRRYCGGCWRIALSSITRPGDGCTTVKDREGCQTVTEPPYRQHCPPRREPDSADATPEKATPDCYRFTDWISWTATFSSNVDNPSGSPGSCAGPSGSAESVQVTFQVMDAFNG